MKTTLKLTEALKKAKAPTWMISYALIGHYDDFESELATPIMELVKDCKNNGLDEIAQRAMLGEFDATKEESDEWMKKEGRSLL